MRHILNKVFFSRPSPKAGLELQTEGSRTRRKNAKVVTMSPEGQGGVPPVTSFWGNGGGSDDFLSLAFGGKFSHKLDHFWPN